MPTKLTPLMIFYLVFALLGLIVPWYFNLQQIMYGVVPISVAEYVRQGTATPLAASLTYDFLISSTAATVWMIIEIRARKMKYLGLYIAGTYLIAFAFTFPLFLFFREVNIQKAK